MAHAVAEDLALAQFPGTVNIIRTICDIIRIIHNRLFICRHLGSFSGLFGGIASIELD